MERTELLLSKEFNRNARRNHEKENCSGIGKKEIVMQVCKEGNEITGIRLDRCFEI